MDTESADAQNGPVQELQTCLYDIQATLSKFVVEAPQAVLMDCYTPDYTTAITKNLQSRVTDLQGQISRLNAEKLRAQEDAAVARSAKADHEREFEGLEAELQNLRRDKDAVAQQMESILGDIAVAEAELQQLKQENSAMVAQDA